MATEGQGLLTQFGDATKWIDVDPLIELLTPTADWFYRNLQEGKKAESDIVEVEEDTLDTVASSAVPIEADFVYPALTTPTRRKNIVSLLVKPLKVGWMQQWVRHFHGQSELPRQISKKLKSWVDSVEFDFVRATLVSGVSGTAPKMSGLIENISKSTNTTVHTSGTTWAASILVGLMRNQIDNTDEDNVAEDVFMGSYLREKTNGFSGSRGGTVYITGNETMIRESIDVYDTGFGVVKFHYHRHIQRSADATGRILAVRPEKIEKSWLHKAFIAKPSLDAPADSRVIVGAATLKTHNQDANWFASGFFKG